LIGVISESEGKVFINGKNIKKHLNSIRNDMGLCPQENMVFPDLNVFEQIEFFGLVSTMVVFIEIFIKDKLLQFIIIFLYNS